MNQQTKSKLRIGLILTAIILCICIVCVLFFLPSDGISLGSDDGRTAQDQTDGVTFYPSGYDESVLSQIVSDSESETENIEFTFKTTKGKPVADLGVSMKSADSPGEDSFLDYQIIGTTDEDGRVTCEHAAPGTYVLSVTDEGGQDSEYTVVIPEDNQGGGMKFDLLY